MRFKDASVIISVYDNPDFLRLILDSLKNQSIQSFEIIISEDGCSLEMKHFIENYPFTTKYKHITQEDIGWRKNKALNNAIRNASGDWLIFVDGDCLLHPRFVEMHLRYAAENIILSGRRVKLDEEISNELMNKNLYNFNNLQFALLKKQILRKGKSVYIEEGFYIAPNNILALFRKFRKFGRVLGCNMSFSRNAIYSINGFDETYLSPQLVRIQISPGGLKLPVTK
jgi:glycosyltransferase involved in cell wall biosynthesis